MKKRIMLCLAAMMALAAVAQSQGVHAFHGEVSDSQCAMNVHSLTRSHQEMLKSKSMGGTPAECSLYCVQHMGGHFVLAAKNDVYHLQNQELAYEFVGKKVKLTGILDAKNHSIRVLKIDAQ